MTTQNVKLTNHARDQIIQNALHGAFEKERKANKARLTKLADKCYRSTVSVATEKAARQAPDDFLYLCNVISRIYFRDAELRRNMDTAYDVELSRAVPFPGRHTTLTIESKELHAEYVEIMRVERELDQKHNDLAESLKRTVYSTSSLKKLIEMWPEVENFLPASVTAPKPMLPALPVGDLNNALRAAGVKVGVIVTPKATGGLVAVAA
jgi:hypothetical protein